MPIEASWEIKGRWKRANQRGASRSGCFLGILAVLGALASIGGLAWAVLQSFVW